MKMEIKIDKKNGNIAFEESSHVYWNLETGKKYTSVTTLIGKYEPEFDGDFWSSYKALERILEAHVFKFEKKKLLDTKKVDIGYFIDQHNMSSSKFYETKQTILDEWYVKNKKSTDRGTKIHNQLENMFYKEPKMKLTKFGFGGVFECIKNNMELTLDKGAYPEFLIYYEDEELLLAGQIDLLVKDGNKFSIIDWKTNEKINLKSFYDNKTKKNEGMHYPLSHIMNCNYYHYTLQLSIYAWMVKKLRPDLELAGLTIYHYDHNNNVTEYHLDYLEKEVEALMKDYKKKIKKEQNSSKRKKFEY